MSMFAFECWSETYLTKQECFHLKYFRGKMLNNNRTNYLPKMVSDFGMDFAGPI
jgi:hypothetical protein